MILLWRELSFKENGKDKHIKLQEAIIVLPTQDYVNFKCDVMGETTADTVVKTTIHQEDYIKSTCENPLTEAPLHECLPSGVACALVEGIEYFGKIIDGFNHPKARLIGVETRTSHRCALFVMNRG